MTDYLDDENDDLLLEAAGFVKGSANEQNKRALLIAEKGEYKQAPLSTVGIMQYINDDYDGSPDELLREIRIRFTGDGMTIGRLSFSNGNLSVMADYGK